MSLLKSDDLKSGFEKSQRPTSALPLSTDPHQMERHHRSGGCARQLIHSHYADKQTERYRGDVSSKHQQCREISILCLIFSYLKRGLSPKILRLQNLWLGASYVERFGYWESSYCSLFAIGAKPVSPLKYARMLLANAFRTRLAITRCVRSARPLIYRAVL